MTKKKKIIIVSICLSIILLGVLIGIIVATRKHFDITANDVFKYNNHTTMEVVSVDNGYTLPSTDINSNGTTIVKQTSSQLYGVYSYIENKIVIPTVYTESKLTKVDIIDQQGNPTGEVVYKTISQDGEITFFNDKGVRLDKITDDFDKDNAQNYGYIKQKKLSLSERRKGIKVKTSNNYSTVKIALQSVEFVEAYVGTNYNYEIWKLTDTDGNEYDNLYKNHNGQRCLVQTLNNHVGSNIGSTMTGNIEDIISSHELTSSLTNLSPFYFLKDGTPKFLQANISQLNIDGSGIIELTVYDVYYNIENTAKIEINSNLYSSFRVGNNIYFQYLINASEKSYDFAETTSTSSSISTNYYKLNTYRFNLNTGKYSKVAFKYLVEESNSEFNVETIAIKARKIHNKLLDTPQIFILNDTLQIKQIDYEINTIEKITNDRYLVTNDYGYYLINKNYKKVCYLGEFDSLFTTKESIMLSDDTNGYTYVCDLNGTIVKRYLNSEITNIHDDTYYMISTEREEDGVTYNEKYLERLGIRKDKPIHSIAEGSSEYTYNNVNYVAYSDTIIADGISIITRVKKVDNRYTYELYNIDGKLLLTLNNFETSNREIVKLDYEDDNYAILNIMTSKADVSYTIVLDK